MDQVGFFEGFRVEGLKNRDRRMDSRFYFTFLFFS